MQIVKIDMSRMRNNTHAQAHTDLVKVMVKFSKADLPVLPQLEKYMACCNRENEVLKKVRKSPLTEKIHEADGIRTRIFRGLMDTASTGLIHFDTKVAGAARNLQVVLDKYSGTNRLTLDDRTKSIDNLVAELTDNYDADVEAAGLKSWLQELKRCNDEVIELTHNRYSEVSERTQLVVKEVRADVDENFRLIALCIEAMWIMETDDEVKAIIADVIGRLNAIIDHYNMLLARSKGGNGNDDADDDIDTTDNDTTDSEGTNV